MSAEDQKALRHFNVLQSIVTSIRNARANFQIDSKKAVSIRVYAVGAAKILIDRNEKPFRKLASVSNLDFVENRSMLMKIHGQVALHQLSIDETFPPLEFSIEDEVVDPSILRQRLAKELAKLEAELLGKQKQLSNEAFLGKAPAEVVEGMRKRTAELEILLEKNRQALKELT